MHIDLPPDEKIIIAIDGYSACGKSTLAKDLAKKLNYIYIDSGAMYRAVTYYFINHGVNHEDETNVKEVLQDIHIQFVHEAHHNNILLNNIDVTHEIRSKKVNDYVSPVSTVSAVRRNLVAQQRKIGVDKGIVMDGRDIGTVVFPQAELKIFLIADIEVRTKRRWQELQQKGIDADVADVKANLIERDRIDSGRDDSPLMKAKDALELDNSNLTKKQQLDLCFDLARNAIFQANL